MTKSPQYPKKNLASYIIPFLLILLLLGSGLTIVQQKIDFSDVLELFQAPSVAKDDKVKLVYQEGTNQIYPKSKEQWQELNEDSFIQVADTIKVDSGGVVVLRLFEGSELRLTGGTQLKLIRLDQDALQGNHITAELLSGQLWGRINKGNTGDADVILLTSHQTIQIHETTLIDILASPETSRVIAGSALVNVGQKSESGPRTRLGTLTLLSAQQTLLDELAIDQLKGGDQDLVSALDDSYLASEWFQWNVEQEKKLGLISDVNFDALQGAMEVPLVELESGLVSVSSPKADAAVGSKVLVEGAYDDDQIDHIFVNGQEATLGLDGTWELVVPLSLARNKIVVSARELDSADKKMVANF
ncbi:MAG: hypothetical protein Q8P95_03645, partial [bacterium]|nr:hypothetical protein [bacterium]